MQKIKQDADMHRIDYQNFQAKNMENIDKNSANIEIHMVSISELEQRNTEMNERMERIQSLMNANDDKTNQIGIILKEDQRKELKGIENQLNTIYTEYEKIEKDLIEMRTSQVKVVEENIEKLNEEVDKKFELISTSTKEQTEWISKTDSKMSAIMEQANVLMLNDANQEKTINNLDHTLKSLDTKLNSLESADLFLQESHRQLTEKTMGLETHTKDIEDLNKQVVENKKVNEDLNDKVYKLLETVDDIVGEQSILSNNYVVLESQIVGVTNNVEAIGDKTQSVESNLTFKINEAKDKNFEENEKLQGSLRKIEESFALIRGELSETVKEIADSKKISADIMDSTATNADKIKQFETRIEELMGLVVSIQFKLENEATQTKVNMMNEEIQRRESETRNEMQALAEKNLEEINQIKKYLQEALTELQDEITNGKSLSEDRHNGLTSQINILDSETTNLRDKMAELEPYTEGINTKVAELSNNVQEKITFMTEMSQEQRMLLERTTESISAFS